MLDGQIVIPKKWEFTENVFDQFVLCHPSLKDLMLLTLKEFDKVLLPIFGEISSLELMQRNNYLYPLNMFLGTREFYLEWRLILSSLVPSVETLAENLEGQLQDRWGGYIAERLFSIYITLCCETTRWSFIEKTVVVFDQPHELVQQRDELVQQRDELVQQRDELVQQRDELVQQRDELVQQISRVLESKSWILTSPFRRIVAALLRNKIPRKRTRQDANARRISSIECLKFDHKIYASAIKAKSFSSPIDTLRFALDNSLPSGLALEFGVYTGRTLKIISEYFPGNSFGFDTFEGLPEDWREGFLKGTFKLDEIPSIENAHIVVGLFQDTLGEFIQNLSEPISFIHLDADLYSSTKFVLNGLNHRISRGCVILFDEFMNYPSFQSHEYLAFVEWAKENSRSHRAICYTNNHEQMGFIITK
jgi:hypothetical protein